jgi:hypothetical protein
MTEFKLSFRTLCSQLVDAASLVENPPEALRQALEDARTALETRPLVAPPRSPSNDDLQNLWMSDVSMEDAGNWPTRAVWFSRTVLERWGHPQDG